MSWLSRLLGSDGSDSRSPPRGDVIRVAEVEAVLASLRPALRADGGDVELVAVESGIVSVHLVGACTSCAVSSDTLAGAIEPRLRAQLPWFERLNSV